MPRARFLFLLALFLALAACSGSKTVKTYQRNGIRFSYLPGWTLSADMPLPRDARVREIVLYGPEHAMLVLVCFPESTPVSLESFAANAAKGRDGVARKLAGGAAFTSQAVTARIAGQEATGIRQSFDLEILGQTLPHQASYYRLHAGGLEVIISTQAAEKHLATVQPGWQKIFDTLAFETHGSKGGLTATVIP